ncbi:MAG: SocA family protein [Thioalkalivibrio sp.]|nr:SocA family protein [Thioalkalivibrio sp.]
MRTRFREEKATQAAARLLRLRGGSMSHLKLIKLLYLVDRESLIRWGRPVTHDSYFSMPHGPVLSFTLDRINQPEYSPGAYWHTVVAGKQNNEVRLVSDAVPNDHLSEAEEQLIDEIFARFGYMTRWQLRDYTHTLPEWRDPDGSSRPIDPADILRTAGFSEDDIRAVASELEEARLADSLFR